MIYEFNGYKPIVHKSAFVHELAAVTGNVIIGKQVYVGPGAAIRGWLGGDSRSEIVGVRVVLVQISGVLWAVW